MKQMKQMKQLIIAMALILLPITAHCGEYEDFVANSGAGPISESWYNNNVAVTPDIPIYQPPAAMVISETVPVMSSMNIPSYDTYVNSGTCALGPVSEMGYNQIMSSFSVDSFNTQPFSQPVTPPSFLSNLVSPAKADAACLPYGCIPGDGAMGWTWDDPWGTEQRRIEASYRDSRYRKELRNKMEEARRNFLEGAGVTHRQILFGNIVRDFELPCDLVPPPCTDNYQPVDFNKALKLEKELRVPRFDRVNSISPGQMKLAFNYTAEQQRNLGIAGDYVNHYENQANFSTTPVMPSPVPPPGYDIGGVTSPNAMIHTSPLGSTRIMSDGFKANSFNIKPELGWDHRPIGAPAFNMDDFKTEMNTSDFGPSNSYTSGVCYTPPPPPALPPPVKFDFPTYEPPVMPQFDMRRDMDMFKPQMPVLNVPGGGF